MKGKDFKKELTRIWYLISFLVLYIGFYLAVMIAQMPRKTIMINIAIFNFFVLLFALSIFQIFRHQAHFLKKVF